MLVLSRKPTERIQIGADIVVTVLKVCGQRVSIGIDAPNNAHIVRTELLLENSLPAADNISPVFGSIDPLAI